MNGLFSKSELVYLVICVIICTVIGFINWLAVRKAGELGKNEVIKLVCILSSIFDSTEQFSGCVVGPLSLTQLRQFVKEEKKKRVMAAANYVLEADGHGAFKYVPQELRDFYNLALQVIREWFDGAQEDVAMLEDFSHFAFNLQKSKCIADVNPQLMADIIPYLDQENAVRCAEHLYDRAGCYNGDRRFFILEYLSRIAKNLKYPINVLGPNDDERERYRAFVEMQEESFRNWVDLPVES